MGVIKKLYITVKVILRVSLVILNNIYCIPTYFIWMLVFQPLRWFKPRLYWTIEGKFFHWLLAMVSMWSWSAGYALAEAGDDIRACIESRTLVLVNHQSTGDVPMLMAAFNPRRGVLPNIMWIMDRIFKYTNFGVFHATNCNSLFLTCLNFQGIAQLRQHIRSSYIPRKRKWMMLFPEGGFLRKRREASQRYAAKNNLPQCQYVSLPRLGALGAIFEELHPEEEEICTDKHGNTAIFPPDSECVLLTDDDTLSWVLDITIGYPQGNPIDLPTIIMGQRDPCTTTLFYRLYPINSVPSGKEALTRWLYDRWEEKEHMLDVFYRNGQFPSRHTGYTSSPIPPTQVAQSPLRFLLLHLFFMTSSFFHYKLIEVGYEYFYPVPL
ncbi:acyl-CoA:lysophosphatidylglycerol acyltransferase 1-like [Diaphorina citri]|uniref:Acyl-CoA:lysophosphatidylglycerol acyltransferase 1-like n=1 Tax=Diaphorina citri TaxID=121845 RepID=A0A3Q0J5D5_DIACI|nr:acyl-CoA:lysophosphatidylglycerol acyltransferase 1-like [Diaphorina citri]